MMAAIIVFIFALTFYSFSVDGDISTRKADFALLFYGFDFLRDGRKGQVKLLFINSIYNVLDLSYIYFLDFSYYERYCLFDESILKTNRLCATDLRSYPGEFSPLSRPGVCRPKEKGGGLGPQMVAVSFWSDEIPY